MGTTTKGIPYPELSDDPNGPDQIEAVAVWLDAALTGVSGQVLSADTTTANDLRWIWPKAREVATTASVIGPQRGQIVFQTTGTIGFYVHDGAQWRRLSFAGELPAALPRGLVAVEVAGASSGVSDTDLCEIGPVTVEAGRYYSLRAMLEVQANQAAQFVTVAGQINRGDNLNLARLPLSRSLTLPSSDTNPNIDCVYGAAGFEGDGNAYTFNIRAYKGFGSATQFAVLSARLELFDEGAA